MKMARTETDKAETEDESLREREKQKKEGEEGDTAMAGRRTVEEKQKKTRMMK